VEQYRRGVFTDTEFRVVRPDGSVRWVRNRAFPITDLNGEVRRIAGLAEDITERKQMEEDLRLANARVELAVRGSNVAIWEIDMPDGVLQNGRGHHLNYWEQLGYDPPQGPVDHATWTALLHPEDLDRVERAIQACLDGETKEYEAEYRVRHRDGSYRWVLSRGIAVRDPAGKPIRLVGGRTRHHRTQTGREGASPGQGGGGRARPTGRIGPRRGDGPESWRHAA